MKDVLSLVYGVYHALHAAAPSSDAARRFLLDMSSYGVYSLMSRLTRRGLRPKPRDEVIDAAFASLAGMGHRSGGPGWLDDQLGRVFNSLSSPTRRDKLSDAEKELALAKLSPAVRAKAEAIRSRLGVQSAENVVESWDSAERNAQRLIRDSGCYVHGGAIDPAPMDGKELESLITKVRRSVSESSAWYLATGDAVTAVLVEDYATSDAFEAAVAEYETSEAGGWTPPYELGSDDYRDQADMARYHHELDEQYRESTVRTHAVR